VPSYILPLSLITRSCRGKKSLPMITSRSFSSPEVLSSFSILYDRNELYSNILVSEPLLYLKIHLMQHWNLQSISMARNQIIFYMKHCNLLSNCSTHFNPGNDNINNKNEHYPNIWSYLGTWNLRYRIKIYILFSSYIILHPFHLNT